MRSRADERWLQAASGSSSLPQPRIPIPPPPPPLHTQAAVDVARRAEAGVEEGLYKATSAGVAQAGAAEETTGKVRLRVGRVGGWERVPAWGCRWLGPRPLACCRWPTTPATCLLSRCPARL